jgi:hypothetical protein
MIAQCRETMAKHFRGTFCGMGKQKVDMKRIPTYYFYFPEDSFTNRFNIAHCFSASRASTAG